MNEPPVEEIVSQDVVATWDQIYRVAPLTTIVITVVGIGYWVGRKSHNQTISTLREWIDSIRQK